MKSDPFEFWYSLNDIARRLSFSRATIRRRLSEGRFFPPGPDGQPDRSTVVEFRDEFGEVTDIRVSERGVVFFLRLSTESPQQNDEPVLARSESELRRKLV